MNHEGRRLLVKRKTPRMSRPFIKSTEFLTSYWAVHPPSMTNSLPVMKLDSSDARNKTP